MHFNTTIGSKYLACTFVLIVLFLPIPINKAFADEAYVDIPHWQTFQSAGKRYGIDAVVLAAIAKVESNFDQKARNVNKDGSEDVGIMQINRKYWEKPLRDHGIEWRSVEASTELNINVGAWVLSQKFNRSGVSWISIGAYNAGMTEGNKAARRIYAIKVYKAIAELKNSNAQLIDANRRETRLAASTY